MNRAPWLTSVMLLVGFAAAPSSFAADPTARIGERADALKAGYLFNFVKLVEWPVSPSTGATQETLTLCVLGDSGVYSELMKVIPGRKAGTRLIALRAVSSADIVATAPFTGCQVLYVPEHALAANQGVIAAGLPFVLTVSDAPAFLNCGGIIELFTEGNRLRFRINLKNAQRARLKLSSSLLQLASSVEQESAQ